MVKSSFIFGLLDLDLKAIFPSRILRGRPVTWVTSPRFPIALNKRSHYHCYGVCCLNNFFFICLCRCASEKRELFMYKRLFPGKSRSVLKKACICVRAGGGWGRGCSNWDKWGVLAKGNGTSSLTSIKNIT